VKLMKNFYRRAALATLGAVLWGCTDRATIAGPDLKTVHRGASDATYTARGAIVRRTVQLPADISASATITKKDGGYIYIAEAGLYLVFPKNAVSADLVVTATAYAGNRVVYDFEPHGTVFNAPIYVVQELRYTELNTPRSEKQRPAVWGGYLLNGLADIADDGTGSFSQVFAGDYYGKGNDALAYFSTTHFSGYAMASGRQCPPTQ
jgi:hypothetical protein